MSNSKALLRQDRIINLLETNGEVSAKDLADRLKVSIWTVRRDLNDLEERGVLRRCYGGADPIRSIDEACQLEERDSFRKSAVVNLDAKQRIGLATARLLHSGERVALAGGTTTLEVAKALKLTHFTGEIVTNALDIALELSEEPDIHVACLGGDVQRRYHTVVGSLTERMLKLHYFDAAIIGVSGISPAHGITVNSQVDATILELMVEHSCRTILVADRNKFGRVSFASFSPNVQIYCIVTDEPLPMEFCDYLQSIQVRLVVADRKILIGEKVPLQS
ncbi:MAG: DeoR/GlpR family DNA-binding transcription regulator [Anaerolineaceae bacterium]|nr:DeoR/GlpR family DNA-binding transcription regulator [Anaerolineaceae bacterium]